MPTPGTEQLVALLIAKGGVLAERTCQEQVELLDLSDPHTNPVDRYANTIKAVWQPTWDAYCDLAVNGVDLDSCTDPTSHVGAGFKGTFTDSQLDVHYLAGQVASSSGSRWTFATKLDTNGNSFARLLTALIYDPITIGQATTKLKTRLDNTADDRDVFPHTCAAHL